MLDIIQSPSVDVNIMSISYVVLSEWKIWVTMNNTIDYAYKKHCTQQIACGRIITTQHVFRQFWIQKLFEACDFWQTHTFSKNTLFTKSIQVEFFHLLQSMTGSCDVENTRWMYPTY